MTEFGTSDYELMDKLVSQGYDSLTPDEQARISEIEERAKQEIKNSLKEEDIAQIKATIPSSRHPEYYNGLLDGFRKSSEMLSNTNPVQFGTEYLVPMEQLGVISYFIAGYCIVLQDEYVKEDDNGINSTRDE